MTNSNSRTKIGINGFGRIGRQVLRAIKKSRHDTVDVVAVNDLADPTQLAHLFKYDSTYGRYDGTVVPTDDGLNVDGADVRVFSERDPARVPWSDAGVEIVIESTGFFTDARQASGHLTGSPSKVIISAPATNEDITIVIGINDNQYDPAEHHVISNASCTTNCVALMAQVLNDSFGIEHGLMSTIHAYTNDQRILDQVHEDMRRARSAANSVIPTTTGAAKAVTRVIPELEGRIDGMAYRVPTITGSVTDLTARLSQPADVETLNRAYSEAAADAPPGVLAVNYEPLVSADYIGDSHSCTIDALSTSVVSPSGDGRGTFIKVVGWYDNEWGYASRTADLAAMLTRHMQ